MSDPEAKSPRLALIPKGVKIVQVSCSRGEKHCHTHAMAEGGDVYSWGDQYKGQLGLLKMGTEWDHSIEVVTVKIPQRVNLVHNGVPVKAKKVQAAGISTAILGEDGTLFTFGCGSDGRLGHPEYLGSVYLYKESQPKEVEHFSKKGLKVLDVAASYYQMLAVVAPK